MIIIMHNEGTGKKEILDITKITFSPNILSVVDKNGNISTVEIDNKITFDMKP